MREIARVNGAGKLTDDKYSEFNDEPWTKGVAQWRFKYSSGALDAKTLLASFSLEGPTGVPLRNVSYKFTENRRQAVAEFDRRFNISERQLAGGSDFGLSVWGFRQVIEQRSEIGQHLLSFDGMGMLMRRAFQPVRGDGSTMADAVGSFGRAYEYDDVGLPIRMRNLDVYGNTLVEKSGIAGQRRVYDGGRLVSVEWLDRTSKLHANQKNFARVAMTYSGIGNIIDIADYTAAGTLTERSDLGPPAIRQSMTRTDTEWNWRFLEPTEIWSLTIITSRG